MISTGEKACFFSPTHKKALLLFLGLKKVMRTTIIVLFVLCSTLIKAQGTVENLSIIPNSTISNTDHSCTISNVTKDMSSCTLHVQGISYKRALDILVDVSIRIKATSSLAGFTCTYDKTSRIYTLTNDATGNTVVQSSSVSDIRKFMKMGEMPYAILGVL